MPGRGVDVDANQEQPGLVRLRASTWLSGTGLDASALLATNNSARQQPRVLQEVTAMLLRKPTGRALDRVRVDVEADLCSGCGAAAVEASRQLGSTSLLSATLGADCPALLLQALRGALGRAPRWHRQQQTQQALERRGLSFGAAAVRKLGERRRLQARLFCAPGSVGAQAELELRQQVGGQHVLELSGSWHRQQQSMAAAEHGAPAAGGGGDSSRAWLEASLTATQRPGALLRLAEEGCCGTQGEQAWPGADGSQRQQQQQQQQQGGRRASAAGGAAPAPADAGAPARARLLEPHPLFSSSRIDEAVDAQDSNQSLVAAATAAAAASAQHGGSPPSWRFSCGCDATNPAGDWLVRLALVQEGG